MHANFLRKFAKIQSFKFQSVARHYRDGRSHYWFTFFKATKICWSSNPVWLADRFRNFYTPNKNAATFLISVYAYFRYTVVTSSLCNRCVFAGMWVIFYVARRHEREPYHWLSFTMSLCCCFMCFLSEKRNNLQHILSPEFKLALLLLEGGLAAVGDGLIMEQLFDIPIRFTTYKWARRRGLHST